MRITPKNLSASCLLGTLLAFFAPACTWVVCGADVPAGSATTELHRAIAQGDRRAWQGRLQDGADVNARDGDGNTPLHIAALHNNLDAVRTLLNRGADANATNNAKATPLIYGIGNADIVRALLDHHADPNAQSAIGMTPLLSAVERGESFEIVRLLIAAGANVHATRKNRGEPILADAIQSGDQRTIAYLLDHGASAGQSGTGFSPLMVAAMWGDLPTAKRLVNAGIDVNYSYDLAGPALNWALWGEHRDMAAYLVDHGADLHLPSNGGHKTPPMVWAGFGQFGDSAVARQMIAKGLDVNTANEAGETALFYALKAGSDTELVKYLTSIGAPSPTGGARKKAIPSRTVPADAAARTEMIRESAQRAIDLMQHASATFLENRFVRDANCVSCHHQFLPAVAYSLGRDRGLHVNDAELGHQLSAQVASWEPTIENALQLNHPQFGLFSGLSAMAALRYSPDATTASMIRYIRETQCNDGSWREAAGRPPLEESSWGEVPWAVRSLKLFPLAGEERAGEQSVQRAMKWLRREKPATLNERACQLLGLGWGGEPANRLRPLARALLQSQRADGGWAQLPMLESDAWATGQTLFALHETGGVPPSDPAYQRGVEFLLRTQFDDGSWWVRNRTWPFQPHFNSQFPHGKDQWISAAGTAWATMALLFTIEPVRTPETFPTGQQLIANWNAAQKSKIDHGEPAQTSATAATVSFKREIHPLLQRSCLKCHDGEKPRGEFSMASRVLLLKGGQSHEPAIVPGYAEDSPLVQYCSDKVEDLEMPPLNRRDKYPALTQGEVELLRKWIDQGAPWESDGAAVEADAKKP